MHTPLSFHLRRLRLFALCLLLAWGIVGLSPRSAAAQGTGLCLDVADPVGVGVSDVMAIASTWGSVKGNATFIATYDLDISTTIDVRDIQQVAGAFGQTCASWHRHFNTIRLLSHLPLLSENAAWSNGGVLHSRYMVKNGVITHEETVGNPWYTTEGDQAGRNGNVSVTSVLNETPERMLNTWVTGPFHFVGLIDPKLRQTGFGLYSENTGVWRTGATLDVLRGLSASVPASVSYPIRYPENGRTILLNRYSGGEFPDPLSSCVGYTTPSGPPIVLMLPTTPNVTAFSVTRSGALVESCLYHEGNYTNPNAGTQQLGRDVLAMRHAIIIIPRFVLTAGTYTVSVTANGTNYTWSFNSTGTMETPTEGLTGEPQLSTEPAN